MVSWTELNPPSPNFFKKPVSKKHSDFLRKRRTCFFNCHYRFLCNDYHHVQCEGFLFFIFFILYFFENQFFCEQIAPTATPSLSWGPLTRTQNISTQTNLMLFRFKPGLYIFIKNKNKTKVTEIQLMENI